MKPLDVFAVVRIILDAIEGQQVDGSIKIAALKATAVILENIREQETFAQAMRVHIENTLNKKP